MGAVSMREDETERRGGDEGRAPRRRPHLSLSSLPSSEPRAGVPHYVSADDLEKMVRLYLAYKRAGTEKPKGRLPSLTRFHKKRKAATEFLGFVVPLVNGMPKGRRKREWQSLVGAFRELSGC